MNATSRLGSCVLLASTLCLSGCTVLSEQRIDNMNTAACKTQMLQAIEQQLVDCKEAPAVARTLAESAVDEMGQQVVDTPRPTSRLAADLRVLTTKASVASSSGTIYEIYANKGKQGCELRVASTCHPAGSWVPVPACVCEPSQD